jgi:hypothetical protein
VLPSTDERLPPTNSAKPQLLRAIYEKQSYKSQTRWPTMVTAVVMTGWNCFENPEYTGQLAMNWGAPGMNKRIKSNVMLKHHFQSQRTSLTSTHAACSHFQLHAAKSPVTLPVEGIIALCFTHRVPARHTARTGACGGLVSPESWVLYDSVSLTGNIFVFRQ